MIRRIFPLFFAGCLAFAQVSLRGPAAGFVVDSGAQAIRPLLGIPGASQLGDPIALPFSIQTAAFGANNAAIAISAGQTPSVYFIRNLNGVPQVLQQNGLSFDSVFANPRSSNYLLYSSAQGTFQFLTDSASALQLSSPITGVTGQLITASVEDRAACAWVASTDQINNYLSRICADPSQSAVNAIASPSIGISAVAALHRDGSAVVGDRIGNTLWLVNANQGAVQVQQVANNTQGIAVPKAIGELKYPLVLLANDGSPNLLVINLESGQLQNTIPLATPPTQLQALNDSILLCNSLASGPLILVDLLQNAQAFFVPMRGGN